jgi:hypothetical protein
MDGKILVIISSSDPGKARTGMMYAVNALKNLWMEEVRVFFFGPAQDLLLEDTELQQLLQDYQTHEQTPVACKFLADRDGTAQPTAELGVRVEYIGKMISDLIKDGYVPMVW